MAEEGMERPPCQSQETHPEIVPEGRTPEGLFRSISTSRNPTKQVIIKGALVLALLGFAWGLFQEFSQLRGWVDLVASRIVLGILGCLCFAICWIATVQVANERRTTVRIILALLLLVAVRGLDAWAPKPAGARKILPPPAPTGVTVTTEVGNSFSDLERHISVSEARSPCTLEGGKRYFLDKPDSIPSGGGLKRPMLLAKPERYVLRNRSSSPETYDVLLEVSVTSRAEPSVAKDWRLCLVHEGKPFRYQPQEMMPSDVSTFQNKSMLEEAGIQAPIKRGEAVVGWLLFRVPPDVVDRGMTFVGSLECRDYLEHRYSTGFGLFERPATARQSKSPASTELRAVAR
jgi:hypothetical protein